MLMRMLPAGDTQKEGFLMSTLRVLALNPQLSRHLPKFEDDRKVRAHHAHHVLLLLRVLLVLARILVASSSAPS